MPTAYLIVALSSYLIGSIPFGYILVRIFKKQDIRQSGSGNIGATNVARSGAKGLAIATLLLDALKGWLPVAWAQAHASSLLHQESLGRIDFAGRNGDLVLVAAISAVVGHCFPVWLRFRGGKGVATGLGAFIALAPQAVLLSFGVFVFVLAISRYVSLASILSAAAFPMFLFYIVRGSDLSSTMYVLAIVPPLIIIAKHYENIRRLLKGTEHRMGSPKVPADPARMEKNI